MMVSAIPLCHEVKEEQLLSWGAGHKNGKTDSCDATGDEFRLPWPSTLKRQTLILRTTITSPVDLQREGMCFKVPSNYQQCDAVFLLKCLFKNVYHN